MVLPAARCSSTFEFYRSSDAMSTTELMVDSIITAKPPAREGLPPTLIISSRNALPTPGGDARAGPSGGQPQAEGYSLTYQAGGAASSRRSRFRAGEAVGA